MRYYRIVITDPSSGQVIVPPGFDGLLGGATYTSFVNGQTLPGAWDVELDIPVIDAATSQGFSTVTVWGVSNQEIAQANDLKGKNIAVYGGMQKGLPLANPAQSGLLVKGTIFQPFGNWIDTDMNLELVIAPGPAATSSAPGGIGTLKVPKNLVLNWQAGQTLATAIGNALSTAFPGSTNTINLNAGLVRPNNEVGFFPTLEQFAQFVRMTSFDIIKTPTYAGVSIVPTATGFNVFDGSASTSGGATAAGATAIAFQDLIGQPTWIESPNISVKTVMRADLAVGAQITLPPTRVTNTSAANSNILNQRASFQGGFSVISLRHVGHYRQASADAWVTVIEGAPNVIEAAGMRGNNVQKTPIARTLNQFAERKVFGAISMLGKGLPAQVVSVSGSIVTVSFPMVTDPYTLPNCTVPLAGPEYSRPPTQVGDKGVVLSADAYIGGVTGLGGGSASLAMRANLSSLIFFPVGNSGWSATDDPNAYVIYGPNGAIIRDSAKKNKIVLTPSGVMMTLTDGSLVITVPNGQTVTIDGNGVVNGNWQVNGNLELSGTIEGASGGVYAGNVYTSGAVIAGFGGGDQVGLQTHTHTQANDSHGDTEQPVSSPTAGT